MATSHATGTPPPDDGAPGASLAVERAGRDITVVIAGDVDVHRATTLRPLLRDLFDEDPERLVIECSQVDFVDSVGLSVLISARLQADAHDSTLVLRSISPPLESLLEITHLTDSFLVER